MFKFDYTEIVRNDKNAPKLEKSGKSEKSVNWKFLEMISNKKYTENRACKTGKFHMKIAKNKQT